MNASTLVARVGSVTMVNYIYTAIWKTQYNYGVIYNYNYSTVVINYKLHKKIQSRPDIHHTPMTFSLPSIQHDFQPTFSWIFFCSSSMCACCCALRTAMRSSCSLSLARAVSTLSFSRSCCRVSNSDSRWRRRSCSSWSRASLSACNAFLRSCHTTHR